MAPTRTAQSPKSTLPPATMSLSSSLLPVLDYGADAEPEPSSDAAAGGFSAAAEASAQPQQHAASSAQPAHRSSSTSASGQRCSGATTTTRSSSSSSSSSTKQKQPATPSAAPGSQRAQADAMQALSKERRRRAFIGMLKLLEHGAKDAAELQRLVNPMSDEELLQVAEERSLASKCGNPLCSNPYTQQAGRAAFRVTSDNVHRVQQHCYCSRACEGFVTQLAAQLVKPLDRLAPTALGKALQGQQQLQSHRPKQQQQGTAAQGGGVETMKALVTERAPFQLIHEAEAAGQQLDQAAAAVAGDSAAASAVEGYHPRDAPATQPQPQRQRHGSRAAAPAHGDEEGPTELLQLQPAVRPAAAPGSSSSSATASSSSAAGSLDGYLAVFRQQQELQMRSLGIQDEQEAAAASGEPTPAADAAAVNGSSQQQQQQQQQQQPQLQRQDSSKRRVTFAPDVAYSCPAQPEQQAPLEQPVLAFTLHGSDQAGFSSSSSGGALIGELQVTSAAGAGADADAAGPEGGGAAQQQQEDGQQQQQAASEAWKLFLPPALGGVGVPVKTVVQQAAVNGSSSRRSARTAAPAANSSSSSSRGGAGGTAEVNGSAQAAAATPPNQARPSSSSGSNASNASSSSGGAEAAKRRFTPNVRPRRSVVVLDEVPGVTVLQRGGPRTATAAAAAAAATAPPQAAAGDANGAAAPSVQQQTTPRANGTTTSSRRQQQVVHIGPLDAATSRWRQASSDRAAAANGGLHHPHDGSSDDGDTSSIDGVHSDASSDEQWCYDAGGRQQQQNGSSRRRQAAADCDVWSDDEQQGADDDDAGSPSDSEGRDGTHRLPGAADSSDGAAAAEAAVSVGAASRALKCTLPFFDKSGVTVSISEYGAMWNQLSAWVTPATVAYVGRPHQGSAVAAAPQQQLQQQEEEDGGGSGAAAPPPPLATVQQRAALVNLLASAAPPVLDALQASVPQAALASQLSALVRTFAMPGPLLALQGRQWQLLVALLLGALSAWRLPALRPVFARQSADGGRLLATLLARLGSDTDRFWALLQLFELQA